jgi:hypothetical protein
MTRHVQFKSSVITANPSNLEFGEIAFSQFSSPNLFIGDESQISTSVAGTRSFSLIDSPTFIGTPIAVTQDLNDNSTAFATTEFVKSLLTGIQGLKFKGYRDCSTSPYFPTATMGDLYVCSVSGKIGGVDGLEIKAGDLFLCIADTTSETDITKWVIQVSVNNNIITSSSTSSVDNQIAIFDSTGGKVIINSTISVEHGEVLGTSTTTVPTCNLVKNAIDLIPTILARNGIAVVIESPTVTRFAIEPVAFNRPDIVPITVDGDGSYFVVDSTNFLTTDSVLSVNSITGGSF